jgi:hypothetical protein
MENLEIILTQTGHNIERIFADKKLNKTQAYKVLKTRNELALKAVKNLNIPNIIRLFDLQRFDIDPQWNGEFTELEERIEAEGKFVRWEDVRKLITEIRVSNDL